MVDICCRAGVAMQVRDVASIAGISKLPSHRTSRSPLQSSFQGDSASVGCRSTNYVSLYSVSSSLCSSSGRQHARACFPPSASFSLPEESTPSAVRAAGGKVEAYFYSGKTSEQKSASKRGKWEIGSVIGAEKEAAEATVQSVPFAPWSNLGFKGGKRTDIKKILVLGAGMSKCTLHFTGRN